MTYLEAYEQVTVWLEMSGIEAVSGAVLDNEGSCIVSLGEDRHCAVILPRDQSTLYFVSTLYTLNLELDGDLLAFCLCLNSYALANMQTAAIGLDIDNRQLIFRSAHKLHAAMIPELNELLESFLDNASDIKRQITTYRQSGDIEDVSALQIDRVHREFSIA
ncbi:MAG: CesT family type III secretion system chaperone [Reinekea sp.]|jgi:hypothetical protein